MQMLGRPRPISHLQNETEARALVFTEDCKTGSLRLRRGILHNT